jgi:hypothetical protein
MGNKFMAFLIQEVVELGKRGGKNPFSKNAKNRSKTALSF